MTGLIFLKRCLELEVHMTYTKEQQEHQLRTHDLAIDNAGIKPLSHIHKGAVMLTEQRTSIISNQRQKEQHQQYGSRERTNFMICNNCFWSASILSAKHFITEKCPNCSLDVLESIPLAQNENFTINYSAKRGLTIEFSIRRK